MARTDILLDEDRIDAIPMEGRFNLSTGRDAAPDIRLTPDDAALHLGGGDGNVSVGRVRLFTEESKSRITLAAGGLAPPNGTENTVYLAHNSAGDTGLIALGRAGEEYGDATVTLDASSSQISLGSKTGSGVIKMYRGAGTPLVNTVSVNAHDATAFVGGSRPGGDGGEAGFVGVLDHEGQQTVALEGRAGDINGGTVRLADGKDRETVAIESNPSTVDGGAITLSSASGTETARLEAKSDGPRGSALELARADGDRTVQIEANRTDTEGGTVILSDGSAEPRVSLRANAGTPGGAVALRDDEGSTTVTIRGDSSDGTGAGIELRSLDGGGSVSVDAAGGSSGGGLALADSGGLRTVSLDGGAGRLTLGRTTSASSTGSGAAENGELFLDDGAGSRMALGADDGVVSLGAGPNTTGEVGMRVEPGAGVFSVVDGNGDPVFRIDTQAQTIETAQGYKRGVIGRGPSGGSGPPSNSGNVQGNSGQGGN